MVEPLATEMYRELKKRHFQQKAIIIFQTAVVLLLSIALVACRLEE